MIVYFPSDRPLLQLPQLGSAGTIQGRPSGKGLPTVRQTLTMSEGKPPEGPGRPRSPISELAPVAVKVEEGTMNRPVMDGFTVDREKVGCAAWCALFGTCNSFV